MPDVTDAPWAPPVPLRRLAARRNKAEGELHAHLADVIIPELEETQTVRGRCASVVYCCSALPSR